MLQSQVDGLLMATARRRGTAVEQLRSGPVPMVLVNRTIDRGGVSAVIPDDLGAMGLAVRHLHDLGHRHIGHVGGPADTSTGSRRAKGFSAAMRDVGLPAGRMVRASPDDLSIVGVNDMPMSDRVQPPLTTVRVGEYELGRQAARLLLSHIEQPERRPETVLIAPELVVRDSSGKPARRHRGIRAESLASDSPAGQY